MPRTKFAEKWMVAGLVKANLKVKGVVARNLEHRRLTVQDLDHRAAAVAVGLAAANPDQVQEAYLVRRIHGTSSQAATVPNQNMILKTCLRTAVNHKEAIR